MERTLGWRTGSIESVLAGGDPVVSPDGPATRNDRAPTGDAPASDAPTGPGGRAAAREGEPADGTAVPWADIVRVLDEQLGAIGQADRAGGTQRLWGAEQITSLARRLRPHQVSAGSASFVPWPDVVIALEATIAAIRADTGMSSEARLWGVEVIVDVAAELKRTRRSLDPDGSTDG
jgi:hypothetical protein